MRRDGIDYDRTVVCTEETGLPLKAAFEFFTARRVDAELMTEFVREINRAPNDMEHVKKTIKRYKRKARRRPKYA